MKVTIVTVSYNNERTIADAIYAVSSQTYKNIEHIIIDGKSTDTTLSIINEQKDKIAKIISEPDGGIYDALNKGIKHATGDIIGFLHADDIYYDNDAIKYIAETFRTEETDSVYFDMQYVYKNDISKVLRTWISGDFSLKKLKRGWMPPHPAFFVKKEIYEKYGGFDTSYKISGDYDIILRFLGKHKIGTAYLPRILLRMRNGGKSNQNLKNILLKMQEDARALRKNKIGNWHTMIMKNLRKVFQFVK